MRHRFSLEGYGYRLRPIQLSDAPFILEVRREDPERNRFLHAVSDDPAAQEAWLNRYFEREGDFYFVVENRVTGQAEGLIAFYNAQDGRAEWGRWVLKKSSLAAAESVYLLYRIAFEQAGLRELYCRTVTENAAVTAFHTAAGEKTRGVLPHAVEIDGTWYDVLEQYAEKEHFYSTAAPLLTKRARSVARRNFKREAGAFSFHHIGVACRSIEKELPVYTLMGYEEEGACFEDPGQGIRGLFLNGNPRLELLENLDGSQTLDQPLKRGQKLYHTAYRVERIEKAVEIMTRNRAKIISPLKPSVYFGARICFLMLPNLSMIELIESPEGEKK